MKDKLEVQQVTLKYDKFQALGDISFTLTEGIYGLLGRNGAGKTSLLSLIASLREPTSGTILYNGEKLFENEQLMSLVSFIYHKDQETLTMDSEMAAQYRPNFDKEYFEYLLKLFEIPEKGKAKKLSKGKLAALNVAVGLASRSPVTIFDEAYLGMDAPTRETFYQEILADQAKYPRIFILSTHLVSEMDYLFDEVLIIHKGKLIVHDDFESLISRGASITGDGALVDEFVQEMKKLNEKSLGSTKSVTVYEQLSDEQMQLAKLKGLEIGPVALQDLFIHLTKEES